MYVLRFAAVLAVVAMIGCGSGVRTESVDEVKVTPTGAVKTTLEHVAETGEVGSELGELMQKLEEMKETDAATAEALRPDAETLMGVSDPEEAKSLAKKMLEKLGGGSPTETPSE